MTRAPTSAARGGDACMQLVRIALCALVTVTACHGMCEPPVQSGDGLLETTDFGLLSWHDNAPTNHVLLLEHAMVMVPTLEPAEVFFEDVLGWQVDHQVEHLFHDGVARLWATSGVTQVHMPKLPSAYDAAQRVRGAIGLLSANVTALIERLTRVVPRSDHINTGAAHGFVRNEDARAGYDGMLPASAAQRAAVLRDAKLQWAFASADGTSTCGPVQALEARGLDHTVAVEASQAPCVRIQGPFGMHWELFQSQRTPGLTDLDAAAMVAHRARHECAQDYDAADSGIAFVQTQCPHGTAAGIVRFFRAFYGARAELGTSVVRGNSTATAIVHAGPFQRLVFVEAGPLDPVAHYDGHHVMIYVDDFEAAYERASAAGLVHNNPIAHDYAPTVDAARKQGLFRTRRIVDPEVVVQTAALAGDGLAAAGAEGAWIDADAALAAVPSSVAVGFAARSANGEPIRSAIADGCGGCTFHLPVLLELELEVRPISHPLCPNRSS